MKEPELKPCPFCGGKAEIKQTKMFLSDAVQAHCTECGAFMPKEFINHLLYSEGEEIYVTEEMAIERTAERWNRRSNNECKNRNYMR